MFPLSSAFPLQLSSEPIVWCCSHLYVPPPHTHHSKLIGTTILQAHSQACFINFLGIPLCSQTDLWINCHNYYPCIWPLTCHRGMQRGNGAKRVVSEQGSSKVMGRQVVITHLLTYSRSSNRFPLSTETLSTPSSHPLFCQSRHHRDEACPYSFYINSHKNKYTKYRLHQKSMSDVRRRDGGEESRSIAEGKNHTRLCCSSTVGQVWKINIDGFGLLQIKFLCYKFKGRVCLEKDPA